MRERRLSERLLQSDSSRIDAIRRILVVSSDLCFSCRGLVLVTATVFSNENDALGVVCLLDWVCNCAGDMIADCANISRWAKTVLKAHDDFFVVYCNSWHGLIIALFRFGCQVWRQ